MRLNPIQSTKLTNIILAAVATLAIAGYQKELGFMNLIITFTVAYFLLFLVDVFKKFSDTKLQKQLHSKSKFVRQKQQS